LMEIHGMMKEIPDRNGGVLAQLEILRIQVEGRL